MKVVIIPGFTGYPEEIVFRDLEKNLIAKGHSVYKIAWPHFPQELDKYSFTATIDHARRITKKIKGEELIILGFSMGGIVATLLAAQSNPRGLGLIVSPYQAGTEDDLAGKYKNWKKLGYRELTSSKFGELKIPFSFIEDAQKYNALELISQVGCPKLFIVGEKDTKVPSKVSKKIYESALEPKEWHQIPDMEHKYQYQTGMLKKVNEIIVNFIESNNP